METPAEVQKIDNKKRRLEKGDLVLVPFPYSDLSAAKIRPALVVASLIGEDVILCQITSQSRYDNYSVIVLDEDFSYGSLDKVSMIRPNRLFTASRSTTKHMIGKLNESKIKEVEQKLVEIFTS